MRARQPDAATFEQAAAWYLDLRDAAPDASIHQEHAHWLTLDPIHRQAWERVQRLQQAFERLPEPVGLGTFHSARTSRRQMIKKLVMLLAIGGTATLAWQRKNTLYALTASHRTGTGERRTVTLADGGLLQMNTATTLDIRYDASRRTIHLYEGEILVATAPDTQARPFIVQTRHGSIRALGTRFVVRDDAESSQVQVLEHAVEIQPGNGTERLRLEAGEQTRFTAVATQAIEPLEPHADAWSSGLLMVDNWSLARMTQELARYHKGHLGCDPAVAALTLSGIFHLDDIPGVLDNLSAILPIRIQYRTRYWIRINAA